VVNFILGLGTLVIFLLTIVVISLPKLGKYFFVKDISKLDFEETNNAIKENIKISKEWILRSEKDYNETYKQIGTSVSPA